MNLKLNLNLNVKQIFALALVCFFTMYSVSFAAVGGKRGGFSAPKRPAVTNQQKAPAAAPNQDSGYKPSKDAKSLDKDAPAAGAKSNAQTKTNAAAAPQGSAFGGMMRNIGLFAGGMFLGSMLGNMFGFGAGMFSDILGLLANVFILGAVFMLGRMLWNKFRNRNRDRDDDDNRRRNVSPFRR